MDAPNDVLLARRVEHARLLERVEQACRPLPVSRAELRSLLDAVARHEALERSILYPEFDSGRAGAGRVACHKLSQDAISRLVEELWRSEDPRATEPLLRALLRELRCHFEQEEQDVARTRSMLDRPDRRRCLAERWLALRDELVARQRGSSRYRCVEELSLLASHVA